MAKAATPKRLKEALKSATFVFSEDLVSGK
jgi:hypothetical protein